MLSPIPRRSGWTYCFAHFTQPYQPSPIWQSGRPAHCPFRGLLGVHSRYGLHTRAVTVYRDTLSEGFSHFVTSMTAPVASGWSGCRVGLAPTGKRRLCTAHATGRHWETMAYFAAVAAFSINAATSRPCERKIAWLPGSSMTCDWARFAMNRSRSGLIIRSCVGITA
jgi:hypothetical protein